MLLKMAVNATAPKFSNFLCRPFVGREGGGGWDRRFHASRGVSSRNEIPAVRCPVSTEKQISTRSQCSDQDRSAEQADALARRNVSVVAEMPQTLRRVMPTQFDLVPGAVCQLPRAFRKSSARGVGQKIAQILPEVGNVLADPFQQPCGPVVLKCFRNHNAMLLRAVPHQRPDTAIAQGRILRSATSASLPRGSLGDRLRHPHAIQRRADDAPGVSGAFSTWIQTPHLRMLQSIVAARDAYRRTGAGFKAQ